MMKTYFLSDGKYVKFGKTKGTVEKRLKQLNTGNAQKLFILGFINCDKEKELLGKFKYLNTCGEWHSVDEELLSYINENSELDIYVDYVDGEIITYQKFRMIGK